MTMVGLLGTAVKSPCLHGRRGDETKENVAGAAAAGFVVAEEEGAVLLNFAADVTSKLVVGEARGAARGAEEGTGLEGAIADVVVDNPVILVRATLGNHLDAGGAVAVAGVHEVGLDFKLFERVEREGNGGVVDVGDGEVGAIEGRVGGRVADAADFDGAFVHHGGAAADLDSAGGEGDEVIEIAGVERELDHRAVVDDGAHDGGVGLKLRDGRLDGDGLRDDAQLHDNVDAGLRIDAKFDVVDRGGLELAPEARTEYFPLRRALN